MTTDDHYDRSDWRPLLFSERRAVDGADGGDPPPREQEVQPAHGQANIEPGTTVVLI